ncbi:MAG: hypothetical protein CSA62_02675 [Planctomycetota bacterium]|nr:MAG: hypothetical protein CSA62_02675 [Planctomycetota bacterium]
MRRASAFFAAFVGGFLPLAGCFVAGKAPERPSSSAVTALPFALLHERFKELSRRDNAQTFSELRNHMVAALDDWPVALRPLDFELDGTLSDWAALQHYEDWEDMQRALASPVPGLVGKRRMLYRYFAEWRRGSFALDLARLGLWEEADALPRRWSDLADEVVRWRREGGAELMRALQPRERFLCKLLPLLIRYDGALQELELRLAVLGKEGPSPEDREAMLDFVQKALGLAAQFQAVEVAYPSFQLYRDQARRLSLRGGLRLLKQFRLAARSRRALELREKIEAALGKPAK